MTVKKTTLEEVVKNAILRELGIEVADAHSAALGYQLAMMHGRYEDNKVLKDLRDIALTELVIGDKDA